MMARISQVTLLCTSAALLAGCQSPLLQSWGFGKGKAQDTSDTPAIAGVLALEEGRAQLRAGRVSAAVASFRIARLDPATAAEAHNGLGVAYAKIGRPDLADRYFRAAIAIDPSDTRFAANLLRMQHGVMMARRNSASPATPAAGGVGGADLAADTQSSRILRGPVHIRTRADLGDAPRIAVVYNQPARPPDTQAEPPVQERGAARHNLAVADGSNPKEIVIAR